MADDYKYGNLDLQVEIVNKTKLLPTSLRLDECQHRNCGGDHRKSINSAAKERKLWKTMIARLLTLNIRV